MKVKEIKILWEPARVADYLEREEIMLARGRLWLDDVVMVNLQETSQYFCLSNQPYEEERSHVFAWGPEIMLWTLEEAVEADKIEISLYSNRYFDHTLQINGSKFVVPQGRLNEWTDYEFEFNLTRTRPIIIGALIMGIVALTTIIKKKRK